MIKSALICSFLFLLSDSMCRSHTLTSAPFPLFSSFLFLLTSVLMASGLFPSRPRKCSGDNMVPSWRKSASLSWSVSVVAEMPASGPRLGREPAASDGSGICPGIMSDPATTAAVGGEREREGERERGERMGMIRTRGSSIKEFADCENSKQNFFVLESLKLF